jgi:hypothetical protein
MLAWQIAVLNKNLSRLVNVKYIFMLRPAWRPDAPGARIGKKYQMSPSVFCSWRGIAYNIYSLPGG